MTTTKHAVCTLIHGLAINPAAVESAEISGDCASGRWELFVNFRNNGEPLIVEYHQPGEAWQALLSLVDLASCSEEEIARLIARAFLSVGLPWYGTGGGCDAYAHHGITQLAEFKHLDYCDHSEQGQAIISRTGQQPLPCECANLNLMVTDGDSNVPTTLAGPFYGFIYQEGRGGIFHDLTTTSLPEILNWCAYFMRNPDVIVPSSRRSR